MRKIYTKILIGFLFVLGTVGANAQNVTVNPGAGSYPTLKAAFDAINAGTHTGAITVSIDVSTTEGATPATLNSSGAGAASYSSVLIFPSVDGITVSGNPAGGFGVIQLKGADNVTIDGDNPNSVGTNRNLSVINTAANTITYNSVIRITTVNVAAALDANNNTIKNCILTGSASGRNAVANTSTTGSENTTFGILVGYNGGVTAIDAPTAHASVTGALVASTTVNNLTVDNNAINSCARAIAFIGSASTSSTGITLQNNLIGDQATSLAGAPPYTSPTTTVYTKGIYVQGTNAYSITGNTIKNILSYVATTMNAIEVASTGTGTGAAVANSNIITGVVNNGTSAANGISLSGPTWSSLNVNLNTITNIQTIGTASANGITILSAPATGNLIERNNISFIYARNAGGYAATGVNQAGTNSLTIQNNMIWDLNAVGNNSTTGTTFAVRGIRLSAGTNHKIYHNTVSLSGAMLAGGTGVDVTAAFTITATSITGVDVRNNIFSNTMTGASAKHACVQIPSGATSAMNLLINNNAYYGSATVNVGMTSGTLVEYSFANFNPASTSPSTNWRSYSSTLLAANTNNDNASLGFTSAAPFVSASDLHINTGVTPTQLESGGATVGVTTDIDGQVRPGPTGSVNGGAIAPDLGADEFDGVILDLTGPTISFTPISSNCSSGARIVTATITDVSGVPTIGSGLPVVYWRINAGSWTASTGTFIGSNQYQFTIATGSVTGDVVEYYFVAQDNASTPNLSALPSTGTSGLTPNPPASATPPTTPFSYLNLNTLSGVKTVGVGGDFSTLTNAIAAYNASCVSGPVVFNLTDATYPTETFPLTINVNPTASAINTLTIKPASGVTALITGSSSTAIIVLNGADYIIIDGSNNGTSSRNLSIENTSTATNTAAIWVSSLGTGAGAINNTIKNVNIKAGSNTVTSTFGIFVGGTSISTAGTGNDNDNLTIQNNSIGKAYYGIYAQATASGVNDNLFILQNSIGSATVADYIGFRGLLVSQATGANIEGNTVMNIEAGTTNLRAMEFGAGFVNSTISKNTITNINYTAASFSAGKGITLNSATATANVTVSNNMISGLKGNGSSTATNNTWAIMLEGGGGYNIYYNSVNIPDNRTSTSSTDVHGGIYIASTITALNVKNNIISITGNPGNALGRMYAIYSLAATPFTSSNYNDLYVSGTQHNVGYIGATARVTLADWQAASGQDANSISGDPKYISATNLHINTAVATPVESAGTPIGGITSDIDGDTRNASTPDIGADEGTFIIPVTNDMQATAFISPVNGGSVGTGISFSPQASFTNNGTATQINVTVRYRIVNASLVEIYNNTQLIPSIANGVTTTVTFDPVSIAIAGNYTIYARSELVGDAVPGNDEISGTITVEAPLCGTYAIGASQPVGFQNLTQAIGKLNSVGASCAVVFAIQADYTSAGEGFPLTINAYGGASAINTFTIKPAATVTTTISGAASGVPIFKILGSYVTINGSNSGGTSRDLTISNTSLTTPNVLVIGSVGTTPVTNVTLKNTILINGVNTSTAVVVSDATAVGSPGYFNNITIENNAIQKAYMGIYNNAVVAAGNGSGLLITGNSLNATGANAIRYIGIYVQGADGATVEKNTIGNFSGTDSEDDKGIWFATGTTNSTIDKNVITNLNYTGTAGYGNHGVFVSTGLTNANIRVSNNMIANLSGDGWSYTSIPTDNTIGIALSGTQTGINVYYNSINLYGNTLNQTSAMSMGIYLGVGSVASIQDNIIVNNLGLLASIGYGSVGIYAATANTQFTTINYNDYYVAPSGTGVKFIGQIGLTGQATLAGWQGATGQDANSVNLQPFFVSPTDLHLDPLNAGNQPLDNLGTPIPGIITDIDEQGRSVTTPDIGADEFTYGVVVPVTVEFFRGAKQTSGNLLDWKVSCTSTPYATLTLERSADGRSFTGINSQQATSLRCQSPFSYVDAAPLPGINYYRLKMTDADGKTTYSHLVVIINKEKGFEIVGLNPNPVYNVANLNLSTAASAKIEIIITDINGRLMQKQSAQLQSGSNLVPLKVATLAPGSYQVTVINEDGEKTSIRFVKQ